MKNEIDCEDVSEFAAPDELPDLLHPVRETIRKIDAQKPVGCSRAFHDPPHFRAAAAERFLAKNCAACFKAGDGLLCMLRAGRGDDQSIELLPEQLFHTR